MSADSVALFGWFNPATCWRTLFERTEVLAAPTETGDRYRLRLTVAPGGGPGIRGTGVHSHPGLVEIFEGVSGTVTARFGRDISQLGAGDRLEVPSGVVHGFKNASDEPAVVDVDMVFTPPGPRPEADLMPIGVVLDGLATDGKVSARTGFPPLLQFAVISHARPEAMRFTGIARLLMPSLAAHGTDARLQIHVPGVRRITPATTSNVWRP